MGASAARFGAADWCVAGGVVVATVAEALWRDWGHPAWLALALLGAPMSLLLLWRRRRPLLVLTAYVAGGVTSTLVQAVLPGGTAATRGAFVPIIVLVVLCYSLGAYAGGWRLAGGAAQPLALVVVVDLLQPPPDNSLASGVVFFGAIVVGLPLLAGSLVRTRRHRVAWLRHRAEAANEEHQVRGRTVRAEQSLRLSAELDRTLATGLERLLALTAAARTGNGVQVGVLEDEARGLLAATRDSVVRLTDPEPTADVAAAAPPATPAGPAVPADRVTAPVVMAAAAVGTGLLVETGEQWSSAVLGVVLTGALVAALTLAVRLPATAVVVAWVAALGLDRLVVPLDGTIASAGLLLVTVFLAGWLARPLRGLVAGGLCLAGSLVGLGNAEAGSAVVLAVLACAAGRVARDSATLAAEIERAEAAAASERAAALQAGLLEERARLARELHDSVGHGLTVVALQAGAARRLRTTEPDRAASALATIESAARTALDELRRGFGQQPDLGVLLAGARAAGLRVDVTGPPPDPSLAPMVLRVVQEALTNALRHAPGAAVRVELGADGEAFTCSVSNGPATGPVPSYLSAGRGLSGMQARLREVGGSVTWSPTADGGFRVAATLPSPVGAA